MPMIPEAKETRYRAPALEGAINQILYTLDGQSGLFRLIAATAASQPNGTDRIEAVLTGRGGKKSIRPFECDLDLAAYHEAKPAEAESK